MSNVAVMSVIVDCRVVLHVTCMILWSLA